MIYIRESSKAALCGIISALSVVIMLSTYLSPFLVYTAPAFAGLLLLLILNEIGYSWAIGTYFSISIVSLFIIADKESAVFFIFFFGFYPIIGYFFMNKLKNKVISWLLKIIVFNLSCFSAIIVCIFVLGVSFEDIISEGVFFTSVFVILLNVLFVVYDVLLLRLQELYIKKLRKRFCKLFNIR